jgi:hypothetical protein
MVVWTRERNCSLNRDLPGQRTWGSPLWVILDQLSGDCWLIDVRFTPIAPVPKRERLASVVHLSRTIKPLSLQYPAGG